MEKHISLNSIIGEENTHDNIRDIIEKLKNIKANKILIQFPEGLKMRIQDIANNLETNGFEILLCIESTFGACDIREYEANLLNCDAILHFAHTNFGVKSKIPVIYVPYAIDFNPLPLLEENIDKLKSYKNICIFTTSQFLHCLEKAKSCLESQGKEVLIGKHHRAGTEGQALGCDYSAALPFEKQVDCFLYLGSGYFHPIGLALKTSKPVLFLNFDNGKLIDLKKEKTRLERIKAYNIEQAKEAKDFGILVSVKEGQLFLKMAERLKKKLKEKGRNAWILVSDEITPQKLMGLKLDVLVNCACPRIDEDFELFKKPILNPQDIDKI